jgi:hypothetical protein
MKLGRILVVAVTAALPLGASGQVSRTGTLQGLPLAYNPGKASVRITAAWLSNESSGDAPSSHPLLLQISDTVPYPPGASATAVVRPTDGLKLTQLAFDHQIGTYCSNGSPRWDVETTDGSVYAFGCASGVHQVDLPATGWERIAFTCADVQVLTGLPGSCPLGSAQTVSLLQIVHDEAGSTMLDNLDVNWILLSGSSDAR